MAKSSIFFDTPEAYNRNYDFLKYAVNDYTLYLCKLTGKSDSVVRPKVENYLKNHETLKLINPKVCYLERMENGDREQRVKPFSVYLKEIENRNLILSPSMIAYKHPDQEKSMLAESTEKRVDLRSAEKHKQQQAKAVGDVVGYQFYNGSQTSRKVSINSISGATMSPHNAYYNKTAHTSMTSTCRITTAHANANNERLLAGNRHFDNIAKALENLVNTCNLLDRTLVSKAIREFNLHIPSVEEVMYAVLRSTRLYVVSSDGEREIYRFVKTMDGVERAAWLYNGDFYHMGKYNPDFMRAWIAETIQVDYSVTVQDPVEVVKNMPSSMFELAAVVSQELFIDKELLNDEGKPTTYSLKDLKEKRPERYMAFAKTVISCSGSMYRRKSIIDAFLKNDCSPAYIGYLPTMIRRCVLGSDTDSSMATGQHWTKWYTNSTKFDEKASKVLASMVYFSCETLVHYLAIFSGNMNIPNNYLYNIGMKNEYMYAAYIRSCAAKHYYSDIKVCEGVVYPKVDFDVKGVQLIAGKLPPDMQKALQDLQKDILSKIGDGIEPPVADYVYQIADLEQKIIHELKTGHVERLKFEKIKREEEYSDPRSQTWFYHDLWENMFASKYGKAPEPPYLGVSLKLDAENKTKINNYLDSLPPRMATSLRNHFGKWNKEPKLSRVILPLEIVRNKGVPSELYPILSVREIILKTLQPFYQTMETIGVYVYKNDNDKITMFSDIVPKEHTEAYIAELKQVA